MSITPLDIRKKTFTNQFRGASPAEVKAFLALVANEMEELRKERGMLAEKVDELTSRLETYEKTERLVHETLLTAQKATDELRDSASKEAEAVVAEARARGQDVILKAREQVKQAQEELRLLRIQRSNLVDEIRGIAHSYLSMVERHQAHLQRHSDDRADSGKHPGNPE